MDDHIATLRTIADAWPEVSPQHAALMAAIADIQRLDKVERRRIEIWTNISSLTERRFWTSAVRRQDGTMDTLDNDNLRAAIDGVPE